MKTGLERGMEKREFMVKFQHIYGELRDLREQSGAEDEARTKCEQLKALCKTEADRLENYIEQCMQFYTTAGGEGHYNLHTIENRKGASQMNPPDRYNEDVIDRATWLLDTKGKTMNDMFKTLINKLVKDLNAEDSSFSTMESEYGVSSPIHMTHDIRNDLFMLEKSSSRIVRERFGEIKEFKRAVDKLKAYDREYEEAVNKWEDRRKQTTGVMAHVRKLENKNLGADVEIEGQQYDNKPVRGSLTDINRVTLEFEDPKVMELAFRCIEASEDFEVTTIKNKLHETNQPPCLHLNVGIGKEDKKWICEIQLIFRSILLIKKKSHIFYDVIRAKNEIAIKDIVFEDDEKGGKGEAARAEEDRAERDRKIEELEARERDSERERERVRTAAREVELERERLRLERLRLDAAAEQAEEDWPALTQQGNKCQKCVAKGYGNFCYLHEGSASSSAARSPNKKSPNKKSPKKKWPALTQRGDPCSKCHALGRNNFCHHHD
jgi:hypothetical protein